ncbi:MAG: ABC transporter ATP-binding protein [Oceanicaulis sp.]
MKAVALNDRKLAVEGAVVSFAPGRPAVDGADLGLTCGRVTALLGPSGSGKSTLLRAIAGLEKLDAGAIRFEGRLWSGEGVHLEPETRRCGVVFQDYALFPHLTALGNVAFGLRGVSRERKRTAALERLAAVELAERARAYPHELSGGEQQRVALARALAPGPDVMLLDEPFSGLDRRLRADLRETTVEVLRRSEAATLIVTHDAEEALALADSIALMDAGRIIQHGAPDALYLKPSSLAAARLLGPVEVFDARVSGGRADTALGWVEAPGLSEGALVLVLVRPEGVRVRRAEAEGALADIVSRRAAAGYARLICRLDTGREVEARASLTDPLRPGDAVRLSLDPHFASVVAA